MNIILTDQLRSIINDIMVVYFLHIPKTGGSALYHALMKINDPLLVKCDHEKLFFSPNPEDRFVFFVRSPVNRFVSGFLCRLREGRPLYNHSHTPEEIVTYSRYKTPEELALDLYHPDGQRNESAIDALTGIFHLRVHLRYYLMSMV